VRLATLRSIDGTTHAVRVDGSVVVPIAAPDVGTLLARPDWRTVASRDVGESQPLSDADLAPVVRPTKVVCVGLNYRAHILEMGRELPTHPTLFSKFPDALIGASDPIELLTTSGAWDYEAELGVVIGRHVPRDLDEASAAAAIAGYTVVNDVTARDWQKRTLQWLQGKSWDATTPVGPWLTTADEVDPNGEGRPDLEVICEVSGEVRQRGRTGDLVFSPAELIAYVSRFTTLAPGDLIATGTPDGVGASMDPAGFLRAGDVLHTRIEGLGSCTNRCDAPN
jgi:acylpyruvate hydrolase